MAVIDLGEHYDELSLDAEPRRGWRITRGFRVGVVLALLLVTVTAGAPPRQPVPELVVPAGREASLTVAEDRLFLTELSSPDRGITALRAGDGRRLWRLPAPAGVVLSVIGVVAQRLIVLATPEVEGPSETMALDPATGAVSWRHLAAFRGWGVESDLLLRTEPSDQEPVTLVSVAADSGRIRWSQPIPGGAEPVHQDDAVTSSRIVLGLSGRRAEVREGSSGRLVQAIGPPVRQPQAPDDHSRFPGVVGDLLFVAGGPDEVVAYGLDRLDHRWTARESGLTPDGFFACGSILCHLSLQAGLRGIDPATGQTRWVLPQLPVAWPVGDRLVASEAGFPAADSLMVLDPATGRRLGGLGRWAVLGMLPGLPGSRSLLGVRYTTDGQVWFARLDPATVTARIELVTRGSIGGCEIRAGGDAEVLVCRRPDWAFRLWRLPG
ncbi:hypothetical protein GCM10027280_04250 [Micromonospora polyrhachis]|uniref:Outer membrane protein assembly factor BamB n=1 Tax=Micromonospora polyrhachis TaxID=1282883 RepID=A0A7W7WMX8_9ACTN|nr:PQQ-binding-like beta-propeller repeat protein [Micromonospora polyrhachis]MBB4957275.1 outer membrane protein assembly factor BamB [Micromonospora polyrhachis]